MKKQLMIMALALLGVNGLTAVKLTTFGTKNPETGKNLTTEKITATNATSQPLYAAVYVETSADKDAELFGDIYMIDKFASELLLRPERKLGKDRNLYFTFNKDELTTSLVPASTPRKEKQLINVGNSQGQGFVIYTIDENKKPNSLGTDPRAIRLGDWDKIKDKY